jgi:hypothetical protein
VARDPTLSTAQQSRRIRRPSEIEFFNRIGRELPSILQPVADLERRLAEAKKAR